ncbi:MAG: hypothetical protein KC443_22275 [Anaerolineales bacterium]|nr:hypothetical protein [Anaerolineales bacterium]
MIETKTTWKDSGYDCDHCGGKILLRTDFETGQPRRECYQCEVCGCQWRLNGDVLRVGHGNECQAAQQDRVLEADEEEQLSRRFVIILGIVAFLLVARFGGMAALRFLIPLALAIVILIALTRFAREKGWW